MSWRDRLRPASFKGIEFKVEDHEAKVGRRLVVNEYAYRDDPYTEDMGRKARRYALTAYLVDDDYMGPRDQIMEAVEAGGVGTLVHPYLGTKQVICEDASIRETQQEGGYVVISFMFVEAGKRFFPTSDAFPIDQVGFAADGLISAAQANFVGGLTVAGVSEWVRTEYSGALGAAATIFDTIRTNGGINNQLTTRLVNQAAVWVADVADLADAPLSVIQNITGTAERFISVFKGIFDLAPSASDAQKNLELFSGFTVTSTAGDTLTGALATENARITQDFIGSVALATEAKALVQVEQDSYEDAIAARAAMLSRIDTLAESTMDDNVYDAARNLRAQVAKAIPGEENDLPRISSLTLKKSLPSIVVAYDLYEGVERETDILNRNKVRHPGFMPGGEELSILNYESDRA